MAKDKMMTIGGSNKPYFPPAENFLSSPLHQSGSNTNSSKMMQEKIQKTFLDTLKSITNTLKDSYK